MRLMLPALTLALTAAVLSDPAVDIEAENDLVMKVTYTGGNPGSTADPVVSVEGIKVTVDSERVYHRFVKR